MADVQTVGVYAISGGASAAGALVVGVPLPVALMAAMGAFIAVSNSDRLTFSVRDVLLAMLTLCVGVGLGIFGGYLVAWAALRQWPDAPGVMVHAISALILAAYGQKEFIPRIIGRGNRAIEGGDK
jgi:predicted ABC-type sugar transport system permease subunit